MGITTHILDTASGKPASDIEVELRNEGGDTLDSTRTNKDGRINVPFFSDVVTKPGIYELRFKVGPYLTKSYDLEEPFYDEISVRFRVTNNSQDYHVPLLLSPYSYSTYRGS